MIEIVYSNSSITADTAFRKFYPAGGTNSNTRTINLEKYQIRTQRGITTEHSQDSYLISGGHPTKLPATKLADSETDSRFAPMAVNDWEPENVTGLVDTAKTLRFAKQYSVLLAQF